MKDSIFRKIMVFIMFVLFVGAGILPSTVGIDKEIITITTLGSRGYIQDLIDNASDGDTIYIPSGTYYENIIINKSIDLIGENKNTTIIDGSGVGNTINITAESAFISGFTIQNSIKNGIHLVWGNNCTISGNNVYGCYFGIRLESGENHLIYDCNFYDNIMNGVFIGNDFGPSVKDNIITYCYFNNSSIHFLRSTNNSIHNNTFISGGISFGYGYFEQSIDTTNTVNGKPLYYFLDEKDMIIDNWEIGQLILVNCTNFSIKNNKISETSFTIIAANSTNNTITNCEFNHNRGGIIFYNSFNNTIEGNNICNTSFQSTQFGGWPSCGIAITGSYNIIRTNNISTYEIGIWILNYFYPYIITESNIIQSNNLYSNYLCGVSLYNSSSNQVYYNNFIWNTQNANDDGTNSWDDGKKGNYWDDYKEKYPDARKICCKGIWNKPYEIPDGDNKDRYPLIRQWPYPSGRIIFTARSRGSCGVAWGYGIGNESNQTPDAYIELGKGSIFNFGFMLYHSLYDPHTNYIIQDNDEKVLWPLRQRTLIDMRWQHDSVRHHLGVICKPLEDTTGSFFSNPMIYLISPPPTFEGPNHLSNCMKFNGFLRNETKIERVSGFAALFVIAENNSGSVFPDPAIIIYLFQKKDGGDIKPMLAAIWSKNGMELLNTTIERAKTFHVNYWTLKLLFSS